MKILLSLLILLAIVAGVRYITNKPGPVDQALVAEIQNKINEMESTGTIVTGTVDQGSTTGTVVADTTTTAPVAGDTYTIAPASTLWWIGRKVGGEHSGTIAISQWVAIVADNKLVGGTITIDMNTIADSDLPAWEMNDKLVWHLKDGFFAVATNPEAKFVVTAVTATASGTDITGDLTLKGVTKTINFPATVVVDATSVKINATTYIDKEVFGITEWAGMVDKLFGLVFDLTFNK